MPTGLPTPNKGFGPTPDAMSDFCDIIRKAIEERAKQIAEEQIKQAVLNFDKQLREAIPVVACSVAHYYQIQEYNNRIVITVNHPPKV